MRARGFTLLEVVVALSAASLVVLVAHALFQGVADGSSRIEHARRSLDRETNAGRLLVELAGSIDVAEGAGGFDGRPEGVSFAAWHLSAAGTWRRSRISLEGSAGALAVRGLPAGTIVLLDSVLDLDVDYALQTGTDAVWLRQWESPVTAPLGIRLRARRAWRREFPGTAPVDTILLFVGTRG